MKKDFFKRHNRFVERITVERRVLDLLNGKFGHIYPLGGVTSKALKTWNLYLEGHIHPTMKENILNIVNEIIKRVQIDSDASKDVFSEEYSIANWPSIEKLINHLKILCN